MDDVCEAWVGIYDHVGVHAGPGFGTDSATDFAMAPDGKRVFATGVSWGGDEPGYDWATVAFEADGTRLWEARRGATSTGPRTGIDVPTAVAVSPDGATVFVTGLDDFSLDPEYAATASTVAYDAATGVERWVSTYDGAAEADFLDTATAITAGDEFVFVAVQTQTGPTPPGGFGFNQYPSDYVTIAYDRDTGEKVWSSRFGGTADGFRPWAIALDPNEGNVYVTGHALGGSQIVTAAYDSGVDGEEGGTLRWLRRYSSDVQQEATDLAVTEDRVLVSGSAIPAGGSTFDMLMLAYDLAGNPVWTTRSPDDDLVGIGYGSKVTVDPDGRRVFMAGTITAPNGRTDYGITAHDAENGSALWSRTFDGGEVESGPSFDVARAIGVSPDGADVYVTGHSGFATSWTYWGYDHQPGYFHSVWGSAAATVAFDADTGEQESEARFNPSTLAEGGAFGYGVAFAPDGRRVYVLAGMSQQGAVDHQAYSLCGDVPQTCSQLEANLADYAVLAYDVD